MYDSIFDSVVAGVVEEYTREPQYVETLSQSRRLEPLARPIRARSIMVHDAIMGSMLTYYLKLKETFKKEYGLYTPWEPVPPEILCRGNIDFYNIIRNNVKTFYNEFSRMKDVLGKDLPYDTITDITTYLAELYTNLYEFIYYPALYIIPELSVEIFIDSLDPPPRDKVIAEETLPPDVKLVWRYIFSRGKEYVSYDGKRLVSPIDTFKMRIKNAAERMILTPGMRRQYTESWIRKKSWEYRQTFITAPYWPYRTLNQYILTVNISKNGYVEGQVVETADNMAIKNIEDEFYAVLHYSSLPSINDFIKSMHGHTVGKSSYLTTDRFLNRMKEYRSDITNIKLVIVGDEIKKKETLSSVFYPSPLQPMEIVNLMDRTARVLTPLSPPGERHIILMLSYELSSVIDDMAWVIADTVANTPHAESVHKLCNIHIYEQQAESSDWEKLHRLIEEKRESNPYITLSRLKKEDIIPKPESETTMGATLLLPIRASVSEARLIPVPGQPMMTTKEYYTYGHINTKMCEEAIAALKLAIRAIHTSRDITMEMFKTIRSK